MAIYAYAFLSKACVIMLSLFQRRASMSTALMRVLKLLGSVFKECHGRLSTTNNSCWCVAVTLVLTSTYQLLYPTVTFSHLHNLSLDQHLQKKLDKTIHSMDHGINKYDPLMRYGFPFLLPAMAETVDVVIVFASHFEQCLK